MHSGSRRSKEATNIWAAALDSRVPIVIDARFGPLAVRRRTHHAGAGALVGAGGATAPDCLPNLYFPEALADRIAEVDLNPGEADIEATFNGELFGMQRRDTRTGTTD